MRLSIRHEIVAPFVVLVLFVGVVGTAVVTAQFTSATAAEFDGNLLRGSLLANDQLALLEAQRLSQLRAATNTLGVPEAVARGNPEALQRLLAPLLGNAPAADLTLRVLNRRGQELLAIPQSPNTPVAKGVDYSSEAAVTSALEGRSDALGDKYLFVTSEPAGAVVYWVAPVYTERPTVAGAILLGEPLSDVAAGIRGSRAGELVFYDRAGRVLQASVDALPSLSEALLTKAASGDPVKVQARVGGHAYGLLVSDWTMRGRQLGYLAVAQNADDLDGQLQRVRLILVLLFAGTALAALLLGIRLATRITQPVRQLVASMQAVSAGNLRQRTPPGPNNEIGFLTQTFNDMTERLDWQRAEAQKTYFATLEALARTMDARDPHTSEHSARVAAISLEIADQLGLRPDEREALRCSGLLHDLGKIGVDDRILRKPGPLTEDEWEEERRHPMIGFQMVKDVPFLALSLPGIRHHHERWNGQGYPDGLKGEAVPLQARIIAVADTFEAMTADRPYRKSFSFEFAVQTIQQCAGSQFDPAVADAFAARSEAITALLKEMRKTLVSPSTELERLEKAG